MAAQQSLASTSELQGTVTSALQGQLGVLKKAREAHSHSDLLLPPDLVAAVLEAGTLHLTSHIDAFVSGQHGSDTEREAMRVIIASYMFGLEARRLVFDSLDGLKGDEELGRAGAKDLFDRLDVVLDLETHGTFV